MNMPWRCGRRATWAALDLDALFDEDMLGDDLDAWLAESNLYKRTFRNVAIIAGLIERKMPGKEKTGRQVTFSSDLIYDVLRAHEPDHVLLRATYADAGTGLLDIARLSRYAGAGEKANRDAASWTGFRPWRCRRCWKFPAKWWRGAKWMKIFCAIMKTR